MKHYNRGNNMIISISQEKERQIVKKYKTENTSYVKLSLQYGCSKGTIRNIIKASGVQKPIRINKLQARITQSLLTCRPLKGEEFRLIFPYTNAYISNYARVMTTTKYGICRIRKHVSRKGSPYCQVVLGRQVGRGAHVRSVRDIHYIHTLVCSAFHGKRPEGKTAGGKTLYQVSHKDNNPINNHADNLEWATVSQNRLNSYKHKENC